MKKTYVLDTNVLLQAPHALMSFEDNDIIISVVVLEELDRHKTDEGEIGSNARQVIRFFETLRMQGNLIHGVALPDGGSLRLETNCMEVELPSGFKENSNDNRILKVCKALLEKGEQAILVTKDIVLRIKAQIAGIVAEDFTTDQVPAWSKQYRGRLDIYAPAEAMAQFNTQGIDAGLAYTMDDDGKRTPLTPINNEFYIIHNDCSLRETQLGRFNGTRIVPLNYINAQPFGVIPRSVGQRFMQEALLADVNEIPLVIIKGPAGTAKTFYALAAGLEQTFEPSNKKFRKILVVRPNSQFDDDIGFLPGNEQEKIAPLMRPIIDNLEILVDRSDDLRYKNESELKSKIDLLFDRGVISCEAMNFMRGRSITQSWLIIDEAQNLTPKQAKGIITRVGKGTKLILLGDPQQIDHPLLDEKTNGLSFAGEKMKGSRLCCQLTLSSDECERSALAQEAGMLMNIS